MSLTTQQRYALNEVWTKNQTGDPAEFTPASVALLDSLADDGLLAWWTGVKGGKYFRVTEGGKRMAGIR